MACQLPEWTSNAWKSGLMLRCPSPAQTQEPPRSLSGGRCSASIELSFAGLVCFAGLEISTYRKLPIWFLVAGQVTFRPSVPSNTPLGASTPWLARSSCQML